MCENCLTHLVAHEKLFDVHFIPNFYLVIIYETKSLISANSLVVYLDPLFVFLASFVNIDEL